MLLVEERVDEAQRHTVANPGVAFQLYIEPFARRQPRNIGQLQFVIVERQVAEADVFFKRIRVQLCDLIFAFL